MADPTLTSAQLQEVEACVESVVTGRPGRFFDRESPDHDLYEWTRDYGAFGEVRLRRPPGPVEGWIGSVAAYTDGSGFFVVIDMWTYEEGRSDLSLEIALDADLVRPRALIEGLHVL